MTPKCACGREAVGVIREMLGPFNVASIPLCRTCMAFTNTATLPIEAVEVYAN